MINWSSLAARRVFVNLESAVGVASSTFEGRFLHDDVFHMAAACAFHIAENQSFADGNKRTGLNAALVFLDFNGWLVTDPDLQLYDAMLALSTRRLDKRGLATLLRTLSSRLPDDG